jgi:hypothetical protein
MSEQNIDTTTGRNVEGWFALYHPTQNYWLGDADGTICYKDEYFAKMAKTILWQMRCEAFLRTVGKWEDK